MVFIFLGRSLEPGGDEVQLGEATEVASHQFVDAESSHRAIYRTSVRFGLLQIRATVGTEGSDPEVLATGSIASCACQQGETA